MERSLFSRRFRECREKSGLSQQDIADVCINEKGGVLSRNAVSYWENDLNKPSVDNLIYAARKMRCSIDYLTGLKDFFEIYSNVSAEAMQLAAIYDELPDKLKGEILGQIKAYYSVIKKPASENYDKWERNIEEFNRTRNNNTVHDGNAEYKKSK